MAKRKHTTNRFRIPKPKPLYTKEPNMTENLTELIQKYALQQTNIMAPFVTQTNQQKVLMTAQQHMQLHRAYIREMTRRNLNHALSDVLQRDRIDVSFIGDPNMPQAAPHQQHQLVIDASKWLQKLSDRAQFLALIPCYNTGVVKINTGRYILFEMTVLETDPWIHYRIHLTDYLVYDDTDGEDGISFVMDIQEQEALGKGVYQIADIKTYVNHYTALTPAQLHWNKSQVHMWESISLQNAVDQQQLFLNNDAYDAANALLTLFQRTIMLSNYMLSNQRPTIEREPRAKKTTENTVAKHNATPSDKHVRHIGSIRFVSKATPRPSSMKTISHWHVDKWSVRGHTRTYANGKTVYIKPTIRHRKAAQQSDDTIKQNILIFKESNPNK